MKKLCFIIFVFTLFVSACTKEPNLEIKDDDNQNSIQIKDDLDSKNVNNTNESEELIVNFLNKLYTIDDPQEYEGEIAQMFEDLSEGKDNFLGYEEFCSEKGLSSVIGNRIPGLYRDAAAIKNFRMSLNDLKYTEVYNKVADGSILNAYHTIVYDYRAELLIEYEDGKTEIINEDGGINVKYIEDEWKVDTFKLKVINDFWMVIY